jgi:diguanylate cyclase (GGDEF)-like protein
MSSSVGSCGCDYVLDLTVQDTFSKLDHSFVKASAKLADSQDARLYLGDYKDADETFLLASFQHLDAHAKNSKAVVYPVKLASGQIISLWLSSFPDENFVHEFGVLTGIYISQYEHLCRSNKDALTTLKNRRAFDLEYIKLNSDMRHDNRQHMLAIVDIDYFKEVNDNFGHIVGDETLISVASILKSFFKKDDSIYRFGGEEFILLLHDLDRQQAEKILNDLRKSFEDFCFAQVGQRTVSIGFAELVNGYDAGVFFERADTALYQAKDSGRNCVMCYEDLVERRVIEPVHTREGSVELFQ